MPTFQPPVADLVPPITVDTKGPARNLFRHYKARARGRSVLKIGGVYRTVTQPDQALIETATEVYLGGHVYEVTDEVACALVSAGINVESPLGWAWNPTVGAWIAHYGPKPPGYTFPVGGSNTPDLSLLTDSLGSQGEITVFSESGSYNFCSYDADVANRAAYHGNNLDYWDDPGSPLGGTVPTGAHLYVVVWGPTFTRTDPAPTWAPVEALG